MVQINEFDPMIVINMDFWLMYRVCVSIMFFLVKIAFKMLMGIEATFRYLCKSKKEVCLGLSWQYFDLKFTSSNKVTIIFVSDTTCHTPIYSSLCPWRDFLASWISRLAFPVQWNQNSLRKRAPRKSALAVNCAVSQCVHEGTERHQLHLVHGHRNVLQVSI